jgi:hypothetical protein
MSLRTFKFEDRRRSPRRLVNRMGEIHVGAGMLPRDCLVTDISDGGARLQRRQHHE